MGSWWNRRNEDAALEKDLRAMRHDPPARLVKSIEKQVAGSPRWARPKVRYGVVGLLSAAVLAGGASANMINVAAHTTTHMSSIIHHLSTGATVKHSSKVVITAARQTPAQAQYATAKPKLSIVKGPKSQSIATGGTATFTITVTNTGTVDLTSVTVTDPRSPNCTKTIGSLAAGASAHYTCTLANVQHSFMNVASVKGDSPSGSVAADRGTAKVKAAPLKPVARPAIKLTKAPANQTVTTKITRNTSANGTTTTAVNYGKATFTITVTNSGNTALTNVKVSDAHTPACNRTFSSIQAGHSKTYSCSMIVKSSLTNVAAVSAKPPTGSAVSGTGHANVTVKSATISHTAPKNTG